MLGGLTLFIPPVSSVAMSHDEDDRVYEFTAERFDDVTSFKGSRADDAETGTVACATRARGQSEEGIELVVRDAASTEIAS